MNTVKWRPFSRSAAIFFGAVYAMFGAILVAYGLAEIGSGDQGFRDAARYVLYGLTVAAMLALWVSARRVGDEARKAVDWMMVLPIYFVWGVARPALTWLFGG